MKSTFGAIVPVYNEISPIGQVVPALLKAMDLAGNVTAFFMDNGSTDGTFEYLSALESPGLRVLPFPGFTIGQLRNEGVARCKADLLAFIDADIVVPPDYFTEARAVIQETGADAVGGHYALPEIASPIELTWHALHAPSSDGPSHLLYGGNLIVRREVFQAVGGFDETLPTGEDADLCARFLRAGFRIYQTSRLDTVHLGNPKTYAAFARQQYWHAHGMFRSMGPQAIDKPTMMVILQVAALAISSGILFSVPVSVSSLIAALLVALLPAVITVVFRIAQTSRRPNFPRAVTLYLLYYLARIIAIPQALLLVWRARRHRITSRGRKEVA